MSDDYYAIDHRAAAPDGTVVVVLSGEFDLGSCDDLREAVLGAVGRETATRVVLDLTAVTFIDSEAVRALLDGYVAAGDRGVGYRVANAGGLVKRVLDVMGLGELTRSHK